MDISYLIADAVDVTGAKKVTIRGLYEDLIKGNVGGKFKSQSLYTATKVICPFHEDIKPSMGVLDSKTDGTEIFNCFGCGKKGNVVHFYMFYVNTYENRSITLEQAAKELASKFNIELRSDYKETIYERKDRERRIILDRKDEYTLRDFEKDALNLGFYLKTDPKAFAQYFEDLQEHWQKVKEKNKSLLV